MARLTKVISALGIAAAIATVSTVGAQPVYETSFESSTPDYSLGSLSGQDSWVVDGTATVTAGDAQDGSDFVSQDAGSSISRAVASTGGRVIVRGFYKGVGVASLAAPPNPVETPMAAVIGFRDTGGNTFTVAAWDGDPGQYVEAGGTPTFSTQEWQKIVVNMRFDSLDYDVSAANMPLVQNIDFHSDTVNSMSEFLASAEAASNVDNLGVYASDGDYDNDGVDDDTEMTLGSDPIMPDTDGDSFDDGMEVLFESDPTDGASLPTAAIAAFINGERSFTQDQFNAADDDANSFIDAADIIGIGVQ